MIPYLLELNAIAAKKKLTLHLVGGFLRDHVLNRESYDFDFAVSKDSLKFAEQFAESIHGAYVILDKEHGCARVVKKKQSRIFIFDFSDFRAKTFSADLSLRDFTINTLSIPLKDLLLTDKNFASLIKDKKMGIKDLKSKTIRMVSTRAFQDDPLRILRAFSLRASLGFKIDPGTLLQIKKSSSSMHSVSMERIREELFKILRSSRAGLVLSEMDKIGLLSQLIPQIEIMYGCHQGGYHHLDVWKHSLQAVKEFELIEKELSNNDDIKNYLNEKLSSDHERRALIKLACLLHDIGKPETKKYDGNRFSFHGHEHAGKNIVHHVSKMLKLSIRERHALEDMVLLHLRPGYLSDFKKPTSKAIYRFFRDAKTEAVSVILLSLADQHATRGPLTTEDKQIRHKKIGSKLIQEFFHKQKIQPAVKLIDGYEVMKVFKLKPSPLIGEILRYIDERQNLRKVTTKEEALDAVRKFIEKSGKIKPTSGDIK